MEKEKDKKEDIVTELLTLFAMITLDGCMLAFIMLSPFIGVGLLLLITLLFS